MTTLKKLTIAMGFASFAIAAPMAMAQAQEPAARAVQHDQPVRPDRLDEPSDRGTTSWIPVGRAVYGSRTDSMFSARAFTQ